MSSSAQDGLVAHILDLLQDLGGVAARRMFGGYGLYCQGVMFGLIARDTLYLRVDDRNCPDFLAAGAQAFRYVRGKSGEVEIRSYMECPADILEEPDAMLGWAAKAVAAALTAKASKAPRKGRRRNGG